MIDDGIGFERDHSCAGSMGAVERPGEPTTHRTGGDIETTALKLGQTEYVSMVRG